MKTTTLPAATLQHNKELAAIFRQMSDCYKYLGPDERFRAIAYDTASKTLSNMQEPVDVYGHDIKKLDELKGVGESIAHKIIEYLDTGRIKTYEQLKKKVPQELLELMDIEGIGPATIRILHDQLGISNKESLVKALEQGRLESIKGFAAKKIDNLKKVLKVEAVKQRMPLQEAEKIGDMVLQAVLVMRGVKRAVLAGSLCRKKETVGDIDILLTAERRHWKSIINRFVKLPFVTKVMASGETKASVQIAPNNVQIAPNNVQVDIRLVHDEEYGAALLYFTGSKEHNIQLRIMAGQHGWKLNEYGVFDNATGKRIAGETEEGIYALFGLPCIPPEQRLGKHELDNAVVHVK